MNLDEERAEVVRPQSNVDEIAIEIGAELGAARTARNERIPDLAKRLKLTRRCLEGLESGDWGQLGAPVYASGYVRNYARLLGLESIDDKLTEWTRERTARLELQEPEILLQPAQRFISFERYARALTYVAATSLLAVPLWWFFEHGGQIPSLPAQVTQSEAQSDQVELPALNRKDSSSDQRQGFSTPDARENETPTIASLTPPVLSNARRHSPKPVEDVSPTPQSVSVSGVLSLAASEAAWVEISTASGERLEYDLLPAGARRDYAMDEALTLRIGNAYAVEVSVDGEMLDLEAHIRNDVANLELPGTD